MKFVVEKPRENVLNLIRRLDYRPLGAKGEEVSCVRRLDVGDYPRFHLFVKQDQDRVIFSLHLDQKKPSYEGATAHSGDYSGKIVEKETERIKSIASGVKS